ncbi:MAG: BrnT family toxin [Pseudomonadota bacterium]
MTLENRQLDFENALEVFAGLCFSRIDDRKDYGEERWISTGVVNNAIVVIVWTVRNGTRRIISMRKANEDERDWYQQKLG